MIDRFARGCALAAALALPFGLLAAILHFGVEIPYWDEWEWADLLFRAHAGTLTFADLWAQHNEHRIFLDNLAAVALDRVGGWSVVREQCVSLALLALTQLVLWRIVRRSTAPAVVPLAFLAGSLVLYDLSQYENFSWGFQMAWFGCGLGVVAAVAALTGPGAGPRPLLLAALAATGASLASSQGLVAWPAGVVALLLVRRPVWAIAAWLVCGAVVSGVMRFGITPVSSGHVAVLSHLRDIGAYSLTFLGTPVVRDGGVGPCEIAGTLVVAAFLAAFAADAAAPDRAARLARRAPWYALGAYAICCTALIAPARAGFTVEEALSSRYSSIALFLYLAVAGIGGSMVDRLPSYRRLAAVAGTAVVALAIESGSVTGYKHWQLFAAQRRADVAALRAGDESAVGLLYPDAGRLAGYEREVRAMRDGVFYQRPGISAASR